MTREALLFACLSVGLVAGMALADPAVTVREAAVRIAPEHRSGEVAVLSAGAQVEIVDRQGGWYRVDTGTGQSGWLPLLAVRKGDVTTPKRQKTSGLRGLLSTYRTGSSGVTVATGVRGLDAVDLQNSTPDMAELARIDQFVCSKEEARTYAETMGLDSRAVAWLAAPGRGR